MIILNSVPVHYDREQKRMYFVFKKDTPFSLDMHRFRFIKVTQNEYKDFSNIYIDFSDDSFKEIQKRPINDIGDLEKLILQLYKRRYSMNYGVITKMQFERPYISSRKVNEEIEW